MNNCPTLNELMGQGTFRRGQDNKYVRTDGSRIYNNTGETLAQAAARQSKSNSFPQTAYFITIAPTMQSPVATTLTSYQDEAQRQARLLREQHTSCATPSTYAWQG
jgi:hypothetical protein